MHVSEIRVKRIRVNQGLGVLIMGIWTGRSSKRLLDSIRLKHNLCQIGKISDSYSSDD